jgi:hypothetical protein
MFGVAGIINALYWMQHYYYKFWYTKASKYASGSVAGANIVTINIYSIWGLAEWLNVFILLLQWVPTALVWLLTVTDVDGIIWFYIMWCGWMHYVDAVRFVVVSIMKVVAFWHDHPTSVNSYSGLSKTYKVSKGHALQYWDFAMEWMGFMTSFGFYLDLKSLKHHEEEPEEEAEAEVAEEEEEELI